MTAMKAAKWKTTGVKAMTSKEQLGSYKECWKTTYKQGEQTWHLAATAVNAEWRTEYMYKTMMVMKKAMKAVTAAMKAMEAAKA